MTNVSPPAGAKPPNEVTFSITPGETVENATEPVTLSWSYMLGELPPNSILNAEAGPKVTEPLLKVPGLSPGATVPPATVTVRCSVPAPPSVPLAFTVIGCVLTPSAPSTRSGP